MSSESELPKNKIYVDEETFAKINRFSADFKSPTHFIKHLLHLYERMLSR